MLMETLVMLLSDIFLYLYLASSCTYLEGRDQSHTHLSSAVPSTVLIGKLI